jgi:hypothetical protein
MPGLLDRFHDVLGKLTPERTPAQLALVELQERIAREPRLACGLAVADELLTSAPVLQRDVLVEGVTQLAARPAFSSDLWWHFLPQLCNGLLARKLPFTPPTLAALVRGAMGVIGTLPLGHLLKHVERLGEVPRGELAAALEAFRAAAHGRLSTNDWQKLAPRLEALLPSGPKVALTSGGAFSAAIFGELPRLEEDEATAWRELFRLGFSCTGPRPTAKWSEEARANVARMRADVFAMRAKVWLKLGPVPGGSRDAYVPETDVPFMRALIFAIGATAASALTGEVADFAFACYRKIPQYGPVCQAGGNACLWALGELGLEGVGQLGKLKSRVKYTVALRLVERALADAAKRTGLSPADLEEIGVPTFDLDERSRSEMKLGEVTARIEVLDGRAVDLTFVGAAGKLQVTPPTPVKGTPELKALKARVKDIEETLGAQRRKLERSWLEERSWPFATFRARLLDHPLLLGIARALVWRLGSGATFISPKGRLVHASGREVKPRSEDVVALWHPVEASEVEREAWTQWLEQSGVEQPFEQVARQTFALPGPELHTNRFAGRRLTQHAFHAQCRERGWRYRLQGEFDSINDAVLTLPSWGLTAQLEVAPPPTTGTSGAGIYLEIETGGLIFTAHGEPPPLRVLSEVMHDVNAFVGE